MLELCKGHFLKPYLKKEKKERMVKSCSVREKLQCARNPVKTRRLLLLLPLLLLLLKSAYHEVNTVIK